MHSCTLPILRCTSKRLKPVEVWSPRYVFPFALIFSKHHRCKYNSEKLYCYHQDSNPSPLVYVTSALLNEIKGFPPAESLSSDYFIITPVTCVSFELYQQYQVTWELYPMHSAKTGELHRKMSITCPSVIYYIKA